MKNRWLRAGVIDKNGNTGNITNTSNTSNTSVIAAALFEELEHRNASLSTHLYPRA